MFVQGCLIDEAAPPVRHRLDDCCWVDHVPGWLPRPDDAFDELLRRGTWTQRRVVMWGRELDEPRLTSAWAPGDGPEVLERLRRRLSSAYAVPPQHPWGTVVVNLYRDGQDAVAWHVDRVGAVMREPLVATVTLGSRRRFLLRPRGGGRSLSLSPGPGDLVVMGGACQHHFEHCVPRCADAGPRMAITIRQSAGPGMPGNLLTSNVTVHTVT